MTKMTHTPGPQEAAVPAPHVRYDEQGRYASGVDRQADIRYSGEAVVARRADGIGATVAEWKQINQALRSTGQVRDPRPSDVEALRRATAPTASTEQKRWVGATGLRRGRY